MIDLRSDTVTQPTAGMRAAMKDAPLGDDVFRDDPSVLALERFAAERLGKEAALYVPTGTMANQTADCIAGTATACCASSLPIFNYETGAAAALAGVQVRTIDSDDGSMTPEAVAAQLRISDDVHVANTGMIAFENTHNACGGRVLDQALVQASVAVAKAQGVAAHLDGARLANAAAASGRSLAELAAPFDTVSLCLSKGLGAPVGSVLAGDNDSMARALRFRKMYGGGMRQAGVIAAAGLYALEHQAQRLVDDHRRARRLGEALDGLAGVTADPPETNLVYFTLAQDHPPDDELLAALRAEGCAEHGGRRCCTPTLMMTIWLRRSAPWSGAGLMGELAAVGSAILWAYASIEFARVAERCSALTINLLKCTGGLICLSLLWGVLDGFTLGVVLTASEWTYLLLSAVVGLLLGDTFFFLTLRDLGARVTLLISALIPPVTALISSAWIGEGLAASEGSVGHYRVGVCLVVSKNEAVTCGLRGYSACWLVRPLGNVMTKVGIASMGCRSLFLLAVAVGALFR